MLERPEILENGSGSWRHHFPILSAVIDSPHPIYFHLSKDVQCDEAQTDEPSAAELG